MDRIDSNLSDQFRLQNKSSHPAHQRDSDELHLTNSRAKQKYTPGPAYSPSHPPPAPETLLSPVQSPPTSAGGHVPHPQPHPYPQPQTHHPAPPRIMSPVARHPTTAAPVPLPDPRQAPPAHHTPRSAVTSPPAAVSSPQTKSPTTAGTKSPEDLDKVPIGTVYKTSSHPDVPFPIPHTRGPPKPAPVAQPTRKRDEKDGGLDDHAELVLEAASKIIGGL